MRNMMMKAFVAATMLTTPALATDGLTDAFGPAAQTIGHWTVHIKSDPMTDKADCTALYDDKTDVQLTPTIFAVNLDGRGGLGSGYQLRYDDAPAEFHFSTDRDQSIGVLPIAKNGGMKGDAGSVGIAGIADIPTSAKRLRVHALTLIGGSVDEDIDLTGLAQVQALFAAKGCPSWADFTRKDSR